MPNQIQRALVIVLWTLTCTTLAQDLKPYEYKPADLFQLKNQGNAAVQIMPAAFLREYDPVTILYNRDMNPSGAGPLDKPDKFVVIKPAQPGEYRWLDPRTIEFRPAVPWKPMQSYTVKASGETKVFSVLLSPPKTITPASGSFGLSPFSRIELEFAQPVDPDVLAKLVTFEVCPLPGIERKNSRIYGASDVRIKVSERSDRNSFIYWFIFKKPFANGQRIRTIVRLASDPNLADARRVYFCDTKKEFTVEKAGTYDYQFTLNPAGCSYDRDQAVRLSQDGTIIIDFSAPPASLSLSQAKSLFNFSPSPRRMDWSLSGTRLTLRLSVDQERLYNVVISPIALSDVEGRPLRLNRPCSFYCFQPLDKKYARWGMGHGLVERYGPQHFPIAVSGVKSLDLRVYKIDPLHKAFWPYPAAPVHIDESQLPPGPGEEPEPEGSILAPLSTDDIARHIAMLGSPHYSGIIDLDKEGISRFQSIDLKPFFAKVSGAEQPGTYLVGFRPIDGSTDRFYVRIQATDLSLSSVESKKQLLFAVTSLSTGKPVQGAEVTVEALKGTSYTELIKGKSNDNGMLAVDHSTALWEAYKDAPVKRVTARHGDDFLVLDTRASEAPPAYMNNHWYSNQEDWLGWISSKPYDFNTDRVSRGFVFTERPVYRPNEKVYFKGMARELFHGAINPPDPAASYLTVITGPSGDNFEFAARLSKSATFTDSLVRPDLPTGDYQVQVFRIMPKGGRAPVASTSFAVEAYRVPEFEVRMYGPEDRTRNDRPVSIRLNASYYAGGKVIGQKVAWKVVSYPFSYAPEGVTGYILSSDNRYGGVEEERQQGATEQTGQTDDKGGATIVVNPQSATSGNPRKYLCEATVTDADDQTVSNRLSFVSVPPFVLGLKLQRHITGSSTIKADIVAIDIDGKFEAGHKVAVTLRKMSWISYLQETDFSRGKPKYRTVESVDVVGEKSVTTGKTPVTVEFPDQEPGVFIVEIALHDRLGRMQSVRADLFLAGNKPVTWKKSDQLLFETVPDKTKYQPGQEARILLKSPFQRGMALAVIEQPSGAPDYRWVEVNDGQGTVIVPITPEMAPRIPVSFLLMRPRISAEKKIPDGSTVDAGRPQTVANTTWLSVEQLENILKVSLDHPVVARPGTVVPMTVTLKDGHGNPRPGEVALWLVDEAVLSLKKELPLDPLPSFTPEVMSCLSIRDCRNMFIGDLRISETPGGDGNGEDNGMFGKITVRKNFRTVPYWNPSLMVDKTGKTTVNITMSDDLTNFAVRAVAVSGSDRFGVGKSQVRVRLPVIVQPALPRFVRLNDKIYAGGTARVVEGSGGAAAWTIEAQGLKVAGPAGATSITLDDVKPMVLKTSMTVVDPGFDASGRLRSDSVSIKIAVVRKSDNASDAFLVSLPLKTDRPAVEDNLFAEVKTDKPFTIAALPGKARPGTVARQIIVSDQLAILKAVAAMTSLVRYPHGCTEQRISQLYPAIVYRDIWAKYGIEPPMADIRRNVQSTLEYLGSIQNPDGLFGYFPGSPGYVYLTAYAVDFLTEIKRTNETSKAGYAFDNAMYRKAIDALKRGLRTDYSRFVRGYTYYERSSALLALARAGELDIGYARELAGQTASTDVQSQARVFEALQKNCSALKTECESLSDRLWSQTVFKLDNGKEVFGGLQERSFVIGAQVTQGEITALASLVSAFSTVEKRPRKLPMLVNELLSLSANNDWGSTQANSLSLLALRNYISEPLPGGTQISGTFVCGNNPPENLAYDPRKGALSKQWSCEAKTDFRILQNGKNPVYVRFSQRYLPLEPGSKSPAVQKGFVVKRDLLFIDPAKGDRKFLLDSAGTTHTIKPGDIIEEHIQVQNPKDRFFVAVSTPFAAGVEYMNPRLETSGEDAKPRGTTTNPGDYQAFLDDQVVYYFESMAAGTYDFYYRVKATVEGEFSHPSARAEMMYEMGTYGCSPGAKIIVKE